ncbi:MAG: protein-L-isoaspartate(D-aspartate) O-methyltransferase [Catalinimonas sp.]
MYESPQDSYRHRGLRRHLVEILLEKGVTDERVLAAVGRVPRHAFFDSAFLEHAYQDKAFPIGGGQTISQPYTVARQTELLAPEPGARVLEIGTGSGYQACVLAELGARVYSVERIADLHRRARRMLTTLGYAAHLRHGDGSLGWATHAPYDGILVTAAAPRVPDALLEQLRVGGRLVIPVGDRSRQQMVVLTKSGPRTVSQRTFGTYSFVPLRGREGWQADER